MNVWHVYARYYNFGDYALGVGVRNIFTKYSRYQCLFKLFDTHTTVFNASRIRELNDTADMLLVGGGGLIHTCRGRNSWMFQMHTNLVRCLRVPTIFYALGYNVFPGEADVSTAVLDNLRALKEKAVSFSVRNDGSRERLASLGIDVPEVPDPGFFVDGDYARPAVDQPYVVIQLVNDMTKYREFDESVLLKGLSETVNYLLERGYTIVLAPHVRKDIELCQKLIEAVQHERFFMWDLFQMLRDEHTLTGLAYYKHASFVIGMRGHAQICAIGMKTPVISILNVKKNLGLLEKLNVPPLAVRGDDLHLNGKLQDLVREVESNRECIRSAYATTILKMTMKTALFMEQMLPELEKQMGKLTEYRQRRQRMLVHRAKRFVRKLLTTRLKRKIQPTGR